ncbi:Polyphosphate:AMP/ADP phosphotransferase [Burkholderiales bacterium 8X]|nr:Polyphosphate:AMP/ADP phosphotransferase [Burkholderiales bacterium 8X]
MSAFKKFKFHRKNKLEDFDPAATPFLEDEASGKALLEEHADELDRLQNLLHAEGRRKLLLVLQGMDTSGKDGCIRWVFSRTSPLGVRVTPFKAPTEDERARDFLWRCHAVVPRSGEIMIWNRSHYEDLLVPVVAGSLAKAEIRERQQQINDFERLLTETGTVVLKCMLHIGKEEQRQRLQARIDDPEKRWKFRLGDLDVRKQWDAYQDAYEKLMQATSTPIAPWWVVPADDKLHRNLVVAGLVIRTLKSMDLKPAPNAEGVEKIIVQ